MADDDTPGTKPGTPQESSAFSSIPTDVRVKMLAQQPYSDAAKKIQISILSSAAVGFAGIAVRERGVEVWWKGEVPFDVQRTIDEVRRNLSVDVKPARYSRLELKVEAERFSTAMKADPASSLHMVQIPVDGSRLIAVVDKNSAAALLGDGGSILKTSNQPTARSVALNSGAGIPVEVVEQERFRLACGPPTRYNDGWDSGCGFSSFSGGGAIINTDNGARCTSGFGVTVGGQEFLLTAGHCGRPGGLWDNGNRSRRIGGACCENVDHDLILIVTDADYWMWDGGPQTNNFTKSVVGWDWARADELVCLSGSTSGAQCNIRNSSNFTATTCGYDAYGNYECYNDLIYATRAESYPCLGGDSGAPVFTLSGSYSVIAKGTVTGCGWEVVVYQDFGTAWRDYGITPLRP